MYSLNFFQFFFIWLSAFTQCFLCDNKLVVRHVSSLSVLYSTSHCINLSHHYLDKFLVQDVLVENFSSCGQWISCCIEESVKYARKQERQTADDEDLNAMGRHHEWVHIALLVLVLKVIEQPRAPCCCDDDFWDVMYEYDNIAAAEHVAPVDNLVAAVYEDWSVHHAKWIHDES